MRGIHVDRDSLMPAAGVQCACPIGLLPPPSRSVFPPADAVGAVAAVAVAVVVAVVALLLYPILFLLPSLLLLLLFLVVVD